MPLKFHPYEYDFAAQDAQRVARLGANVTAWPADEVHAAICAVKNIPVIAVTAQAMIGDRERCLEAGALGYVSKPINLDELVELLNGLI